MADAHKTQVVVIGGGPAGSTVSTLLAQKGIRVELFERERFPRFHIGESLIPETYWVLKRLKMLDKMKTSHFVKKHSVQFVNASGKVSTPFYFFDNKPHECSQTWQVVRSEFDEMMLNNAAEQGVHVHQETRVLEVLFEGDQAVGVVVAGVDGKSRTVKADVVVDASGQSSMIINKFGLRMPDKSLNKGIFGLISKVRTVIPVRTKALHLSCKQTIKKRGFGISRSTVTSSALAWWGTLTIYSGAAAITKRHSMKSWNGVRT